MCTAHQHQEGRGLPRNWPKLYYNKRYKNNCLAPLEALTLDQLSSYTNRISTSFSIRIMIFKKPTQFYADTLNTFLFFPPKKDLCFNKLFPVYGISHSSLQCAEPHHCPYLQELEEGPVRTALGSWALLAHRSIPHPCPVPGRTPGAAAPPRCPTSRSSPLRQPLYHSLADPHLSEFPATGIQTTFSGEGSE